MKITNAKANKRRLIPLCAVLALILVLFRPAQIRLGEMLALRSETLTTVWFHELITASPRPRRLILRAWDTGKVPHRYEVLSLLHDFGATNILSPEDFHRIISSALTNPDEDTRQLALSIAMLHHDPGFTDGAIRQLRDVDFEMRFAGLKALRAANSRLALPALAGLLNDPDHYVAGTSLLTFQHLSKEDFGLRGGQSTNELRAAAARALEWWSTHKTNYAAAPTLSPVPPDSGPIISDFTLADLDGNSARLSDYRGKTVLLNFWTTWCGACRSEFPTLNELQARHTNDFVILAISLDGANGENFKSDDKPSDADKPATVAEIRKEVLRVSKTQKLAYKILLDPTAEIGSRFNGGALPTNVLIDREGRLRRRFVGTRDLETLEAMLAEIR